MSHTKLEALGQCVPPLRRAFTNVAIWRVSMSSRFISVNHFPYLPVVTNPEKKSLYPDGDPDRHQNLITCSLAHCQPSLKISYKALTNNDDYISSLAVVTKSCARVAFRLFAGKHHRSDRFEYRHAG